MEEIKTQLTQTGFNLDRLRQDNKIDDEAYTILKDRNKQALIMCDDSNRRELLTTFRTWWWGNRETATDITNNDLDRYLGDYCCQ